MFRKFSKRFKGIRLSLSSKLTLGLSAIAAILLLSGIISLLEYRRMSDYVSDLIATNINGINISQKLSNAADNYNLRILDAIGSNNPTLDFEDDNEVFMSHYDSLATIFSSEEAVARVDSVMYSYSAYMLTSLEMGYAVMSDFIDARAWYFDRLQPRYSRLKSDIEKLNDMIYVELRENSKTFEAGFYRSIIPGVVSVGAGLLLVMLFLVFILLYYVRPLKRMLGGLKDYRAAGKQYVYDFDGDDELVELNEGLKDLTEENAELKRRITRLREEREKFIESSSVSDI